MQQNFSNFANYLRSFIIIEDLVLPNFSLLSGLAEMNHRNPAIKRILADVKELQKHPSSRYHAAPLENNMFEWHFTIRGPKDSAFEGGMYHGRILLPSEYPFKPPNIVFLTVS